MNRFLSSFLASFMALSFCSLFSADTFSFRDDAGRHLDVLVNGKPVQKAYNEFAGTTEPGPKVTLRPADGAKPSPPKPTAVPAPTEPATPAAPAPAQAPAQAPAGSVPAKTETASDGGPKRAGGGPEKPVLKFKLPPPPVLTAEEELKTLKVAKGFRVELVASEPMIEAPVAISFDDQARMYVVEMRGYMLDVDGTGEELPTGRVSRLEDTDGDGRMDKKTVFADKLILPRAVMALGDGVLIGEPPHLKWFRDMDGDGVAEKVEIIADNFGKAGGQPEHMANSPTWFMDNWIGGAMHPFRYRFQGGKFLSEAGATGGQWGMTQDDWGRPYFNYSSALLYSHLVPPQFYARNPNLLTRTGVNYNVMETGTTWPSHPTPGVNRGYTEGANRPDGTFTDGTLRADGTLSSVTAVCGATIYRGDLFPKEFSGNVFVPEPSANLIKRLILDEEGGVITGRNAYEGEEFLTSTDERFRPVNAYTGPDGALYIVDMARGVIQHKAFLTYYLTANIKDRNLEQPVHMGRIYRIVPEGSKPKRVKMPKVTAGIVPMLAHANGWVRDTAQRLLVERNDVSALDALKKLVVSGTSPQARGHALWTLEGMAALAPEIITPALRDPDPKVRATAVRLADRTLVPELVKLADDKSAEVRLQLALSLGLQPGQEVDQALKSLLQQGGSALLAEAVVSGLRGRELEFLEMLIKEPVTADDKIAGTGIFPLLANATMNQRRAVRTARLIEVIGTLPAGSPRQNGLLQGTVPKAGAHPKLIYLDAEPAAFAGLRSNTDPKIKPLIAGLDAQVAWPGKAGVPPPPKIEPLTGDQQALFEKGRTIYAGLCAACHQPGGAGLDGLAPPLLDSDWVLGKADIPVRILLHGMSGPVVVGGTTWRLDMPPLSQLTDEDIAAVLTYTRREWEHTASPVAPADVAKLRATFQGRTKAWTAEELKKPLFVVPASAQCL